jgi:predicted nucleotidyltransferase component of viral defense system
VTGSSNLAASVRQRLLNRARERGEELQYLLMRYALERFLYRLGRSDHAERLVLKGAMLFAAWSDQPHRATRDADFLAFGPSDAASMEQVLRDIALVVVDVPDGLVYQAGAIRIQEVGEDRRYTGLRASFDAELGKARIPVLLDFGFGDAVSPMRDKLEYPTLLDMPSPRIRAYPPEAVVAEKLEAMVSLGIANSRMKDFYDLSVMARTMSFRAGPLGAAISATFTTRHTRIDAVPFAFTDAFTRESAKRSQWQAFVRRTRLADQARTLDDCVGDIEPFLGPMLEALAAGRDPDDLHWTASGAWTTGE